MAQMHPEPALEREREREKETEREGERGREIYEPYKPESPNQAKQPTPAKLKSPHGTLTVQSGVRGSLEVPFPVFFHLRLNFSLSFMRL